MRMKIRLLAMPVLLGASIHCIAADAVKVTPAQKVLAAENGRYVFGQISDYRKDQYMLDTRTGRLWRIVMAKFKDAKGDDVPGEGYPVLEQIPFEDTKGIRSEEPPQK